MVHAEVQWLIQGGLAPSCALLPQLSLLNLPSKPEETAPGLPVVSDEGIDDGAVMATHGRSRHCTSQSSPILSAARTKDA